MKVILYLGEVIEKNDGTRSRGRSAQKECELPFLPVVGMGFRFSGETSDVSVVSDVEYEEERNAIVVHFEQHEETDAFELIISADPGWKIEAN